MHLRPAGPACERDCRGRSSYRLVPGLPARVGEPPPGGQLIGSSPGRPICCVPLHHCKHALRLVLPRRPGRNQCCPLRRGGETYGKRSSDSPSRANGLAGLFRASQSRIDCSRKVHSLFLLKPVPSNNPAFHPRPFDCDPEPVSRIHGHFVALKRWVNRRQPFPLAGWTRGTFGKPSRLISAEYATQKAYRRRISPTRRT